MSAGAHAARAGRHQVLERLEVADAVGRFACRLLESHADLHDVRDFLGVYVTAFPIELERPYSSPFLRQTDDRGEHYCDVEAFTSIVSIIAFSCCCG